MNNHPPQTIKNSYSNFQRKDRPVTEKYTPYVKEKHFGNTFTELWIAELAPWIYSRYLREWENPEKNWAKIGLNSWEKNLKSGWEFDNDAFSMNYFAHPYHGSVYYNVGRTNGYSFGESAVWTFSGSIIWELFGENTRPSINDWVNTSINGITLGEITYRLSVMITDNEATGMDRFWKELAGGIINPVRGINRLITGEATRVYSTPAGKTPENFYIFFSGGFRQLDKDLAGNKGKNEIIKEGSREGLFDFDITYNNGFRKDLNEPFSSFDISASLVSGTPSLTRLEASGNIYGIKLHKDKSDIHIFGVSLDYDYYNTPHSIYGGTSVTPNISSQFKLTKELNVETMLGLNLIFMGATPGDSSDNKEKNNYEFGPGLGSRASVKLKKGIWDLVNIDFRGQKIWANSGSGHSSHFLYSLWLEMQYPLTGYFAAGFGAGYYWRKSYYNVLGNLTSGVPVLKVFFRTAVY